MPAINLNFLQSLKVDYKNFPIFIENGTYLGETIFGMEPYFENLYTIEVSPNLHYHTKSNYSGNKIDFILGDSYKIISLLIPNLKKPTIFFLDAHLSGGHTGKGEKDVPLYEEIKTIMDNFDEEAILIVDDFRMFGNVHFDGLNTHIDWSPMNKESIMELVKDRVTDSYHLPSELSDDDRLIIHIKKK